MKTNISAQICKRNLSDLYPIFAQLLCPLDLIGSHLLQMKQNWAKSNRIGSNEQHWPPELELNIWTLQKPELKIVVVYFSVVSFLIFFLQFSLGNWQLWISPHPIFDTIGIGPKHQFVQPTPPSFSHQTMPQECNFTKLKRKWVWGGPHKKTKVDILKRSQRMKEKKWNSHKLASLHCTEKDWNLPKPRLGVL